MKKEDAENPPEPPARGVSLMQMARRELAEDPQLHLFPEQRAYLSFQKYCRMLNIIPVPTFEQWKDSSARAFGEPRYELKPLNVR